MLLRILAELGLPAVIAIIVYVVYALGKLVVLVAKLFRACVRFVREAWHMRKLRRHIEREIKSLA